MGDVMDRLVRVIDAELLRQVQQNGGWYGDEPESVPIAFDGNINLNELARAVRAALPSYWDLREAVKAQEFARIGGWARYGREYGNPMDRPLFQAFQHDVEDFRSIGLVVESEENRQSWTKHRATMAEWSRKARELMGVNDNDQYFS